MPRKVDQKEVLQRFRQAHGRYYNYSLVNYKKMWTKVTIICPKHGKFTQAPVNHINGMGCNECGKDHGGPTGKLTRESFIKRSKEVFGKDAFDYSKTVYKTSREKVTLICKVHDHEFSIKVNTHLTKPAGCPICGEIRGRQKLRETFRKFDSFKEFVKGAQQIHSKRYTYHPFDYMNGKQLVQIDCPQHGTFKQRIINHFMGRGCDLCARVVRADKLRNTTEDFISAAKEVHGDRYGYNRVKYKNGHTKVEIVCKKHGVFKQDAVTHLSGRGCLECGFESGANLNRMRQEEFVKRSKKAHGRLYDYSKLVYKNSVTKVDIICKKHGLFSQLPQAHLKGVGCPTCQSSRGELTIQKFLKDQKIRFIHQWRDHDCKDKRNLIFDFYLPKHATIIEFDGIQHYIPVSFGGEQSDAEILAAFEQVQFRDSIKRKWAKANGLKLIRIKYTDDIIKALRKHFP